jgi:hypothetical protein
LGKKRLKKQDIIQNPYAIKKEKVHGQYFSIAVFISPMNVLNSSFVTNGVRETGYSSLYLLAGPQI